MTRYLAIIFGAASLCLAGCRSTLYINGIPHFAQVNPGLYRGGQPLDQGWQYLRSIGVSNVVKLNMESEGSDAEAERLGMTVYRFPITTGEQLESGPKLSTIAKAVAIMEQPGTYVHCLHGNDRTGLAVGTYRVWIDHWTKARAYAEMKQFWFHPLLKGLYDFWEDKVQ